MTRPRASRPLERIYPVSPDSIGPQRDLIVRQIRRLLVREVAIMAIHEFECSARGERFEVTRPMSEHDLLKQEPPTCPKYGAIGARERAPISTLKLSWRMSPSTWAAQQFSSTSVPRWPGAAGFPNYRGRKVRSGRQLVPRTRRRGGGVCTAAPCKSARHSACFWPVASTRSVRRNPRESMSSNPTRDSLSSESA